MDRKHFWTLQAPLGWEAAVLAEVGKRSNKTFPEVQHGLCFSMTNRVSWHEACGSEAWLPVLCCRSITSQSHVLEF